MTYIITLNEEQFMELYDLLVDQINLHPPLIKSVLERMDMSKQHYREREVVLRELLGLPYNPNI